MAKTVKTLSQKLADALYGNMAQDPANPIDGCWIWTARKFSKNGYGQLQVWHEGHKRSFLAHRVSYELAIGPIGAGLQLDHLCSRPLCVNPLHLEEVTCAENVRRSRTAKVTRAQVDEIRILLASGDLTQKEIGQLYGLNQQAISHINTNRNWK